MLGKDIMISAGGFLHGHPGGTRAGAKAFRDAAEKRQSAELDAAVAKWGRG
jgi:ribulose-bisphosphate carboxylase large chain